MGIERNVAAVIVREHAWRPITGDVVLLGRQTMFFSPDDAKQLLFEVGVPVPDISFAPEAKTRLAKTNYISDSDFFRLLGIQQIRALDVSDYEGADIVHDLTKPIPDAMEGIADFILDGSTLDNVFDPATVLRNIARLLRPGGRLVSVNVASNSYGPYIIPTAHLLLDYFVMNGFADCKVYVFVYGAPGGGINVFAPDLGRMRKGYPQPNNFTSNYVMGIVLMAEKGPRSTWEQSPVQHQYRTEWDTFAANLEVIERSSRPELARSTAACVIDDTEFLYVDHKGFKCAPPAISYSAVDQMSVLQNTQGATLVRELRRRVMRRLLKVGNH
jgi:SAM-dependent methyltransferase